MFQLSRRKVLPSVFARRCFASLPVMSNEIKLPNLTLEEVPHRNFYHHLCETGSAFIKDILKVKVRNVSPGRLTLEMPFHADLAGNPHPKSMHGGVIAAAIDHAAGFACWSTFDGPICSTINMRIDYLKPLLFTDQSLLLEAFVERIDDEKDILHTTVVCYNSERSKQVAVGRAVFNRYTPKLGVLDKVKPVFRVLWDVDALNFLGKAFLKRYESLNIAIHKKKFKRKQKSLPIFSIENEQKKLGGEVTGNDSRIYNGLSEEAFVQVCEEEPVFGHKVLGLRVLSISPGRMTTAMPFKNSFMGNFVTGAMHGGVTASLVDQTAGMCARSAVPDSEHRVSTVDFSIDYLAPAPFFEHLICDARVVNAHGQSEERRGGDNGGSSRDSGGGGGSLIFVEATCWNESRTIIIGVAKLTFNVYERIRS